MLNKIALRRLRCWVNLSDKVLSQEESAALEFELGQLGFKIAGAIASITKEQFEEAIAVLKEMRGSNVNYVPLFANFPDELPNDNIYFLRRILGFWGINTFNELHYGADPITQMQREDLWRIVAAAQQKKLQDSHTEWIELKAISKEKADTLLRQWALNLLYGATPVQESLWNDIFSVLQHLNIEIDSDSEALLLEVDRIRIKESLARVAAHQWQQLGRIVVKTPTDLLRMFAFIQGQDVSLAKPVSFKGLKLSKPQRRAIVAFLSKCPALAEDLLRYKQLWISLSKWIHSGDYALQYPKVATAFDNLRNNRIRSFESKVINSPVSDRIPILMQRPSMLLRRLTWLLKEVHHNVVTDALMQLIAKDEDLPLPLLMSAYCAISSNEERVVVNKKGNPCVIGKRKLLNDVSDILLALDTLILTSLRNSQDWDKVWIDPALDKLVIPLQTRKQSDGLLNLARGSRIPIDAEAETLRLFVYWQQSSKRTDLDLSAIALNQDFSYQGHVSWNRYGSGADIAHSGDIQSAELGATEFIDLKMQNLQDDYILPVILRYSGEEFSELSTCYAGWMNRKDTDSSTVLFDPKTVTQKAQVNQDGKTWIPFMLDVAAKEIVYVDLFSKGDRNIERNDHFPALAKAIANYWHSKPTFGMLTRWYVRANHAILVDKESASTTIGCSDDCSINVFKLVGEEVTSF